MEAVYLELTKQWCDALLAHQVTQIRDPGIYGGILCPACSRIHGRCFEAVHPLLVLADKLKEPKYLDAAVRLFDWSEHVSCPDGSWLNETDSEWKGITVFGALALGQAVLLHGALLGEARLAAWKERLRKASQYLYDNIVFVTGNINYPVVCAAALAVAGEALGDPAFSARGRDLAHGSLRYFTESRLLFGEGHPADGVSKRGYRPVDLCYNVEESLPGLALYGLVIGDEDVLAFVSEAMAEHLQFMLPDGGWDNSWGSRNYKWTYWGGRTSDGCQAAYALMADRNPVFGEAARRNAELLRRCTRGGLLGAPHQAGGRRPACIHHTFCHAKAMATVLDFAPVRAEMPDPQPPVRLPREEACGVREYGEIATWLAAKGPWRATVTAYDWEYMKQGHASGGALSLLWHEKAGAVLAASLTEYTRPEPGNMPVPVSHGHECLTPRIELKQGGEFFRSISDLDAAVGVSSGDREIRFEISGKLVDGAQENPASGPVGFEMRYLFTEGRAEIRVKADAATEGVAPVFVLPVIASREDKAERTQRGVAFRKNGGILLVEAESPMEYPNLEDRVYNLVPGLEAVALRIPLRAGECTAVEIRFAEEA